MNRIVTRAQKRGRKVYLSIFLTYLVFSLVLFLMVLVLSANTYRVLYDDTRRLGETMVGTAVKQVQDGMVEYVKLCEAVAQSPQVEAYASLPAVHRAELGMGAYYLQKAMMSHYSSTVKDIAVYFPNSRSIVTLKQSYGAWKLSQYLSSYQGCSEDTLEALLEEGGYNMRTFGPEKNWVTLAMPGRALVMVEYDITSLLGELSTSGALAMIGDKGQLLWASAPGVDTKEYIAAMDTMEKQAPFVWEGNKYLGTQTMIPFSRQNLVLGIPVDAFTFSLRDFGRTLGAVLAAGAAVVFLLVIFFSKRQYSPLEGLLVALEDAEGNGSYGRLAEAAARRLAALQEENEGMRTDMGQVMPFALGKLLLRLMKMDERHRAGVAAHALRMAGLQEADGYALLGFYYMEDTRGLFRDEGNNMLRDNRLGLEYFMLNNVLTDMLFEKYHGCIACVEDYYIAVLHVEDSAKMADIQKAGDHCRDFYGETLGVELAVTRPLCGKGASQLENVFRQVYEEISHRRFWHNHVVEARRPGTGQDTYYKSIHTLIACLDGQNYQEAYAVVQTILDSGSLPYGEQDLQKAVYRIYGMIVAIVSAIDETNSAFAQQLNLEERLYKIRDVEAFRREVEKLFAELIRHKREISSSEEPRLVREIRLYLEAHYADPDISVASAAAHFGISESYFTRQFKQFTGYNGLEYIQKLRVEQAKELLRTRTVKEAAQKIGFWDTQALIRVFKKYEGITPGKYKEIVCAQQSADVGN